MWCRVSSTSARGSRALAARAANWSSPTPMSTWQQRGEPVLQAHRARVPLRLPRQSRLEHAGHLLEGAVLEQSGEQQVARLEQREVLLVLDVPLRQQAGGLEVQQGGGDQEERRGLVEVPLVAVAGGGTGLDVRDELVGDLRERDLGDVELVLGDQAEQQVERTLEVVQAQLEGRGLARRGIRTSRGDGHPSLSRWTNALFSPFSSRSARTTEMASRAAACRGRGPVRAGCAAPTARARSRPAPAT